MIRSRINYWSCSKLANFIRGEKKPYALELKQWNQWHKKIKKEKPIRYYITEKLLNKIQNIIYFPFDLYYSITTYCKNRFITQTHVLKTNLQKGQWHDLDIRILYGLFNELVEFVEIELAHLSKYNHNKKYIFKNRRCIPAAYDYFEWASNLRYDEDYGCAIDDPNYNKLTPQAENAIEIKNLYEWWTTIRPNRNDPHESITKKTHGKNYFMFIDEIEKKYELEDTEMLIKLIKLRNHLWT